MLARFKFSYFLMFAILGTGAIFAGDYNEKTIVSFAAPVEIPGHSLPAGTYVFKILDTSTENNVMQVFDATESHLIATFLAIPDYAPSAAQKTVIMFEERPSDTPEAVRAVFCKGDHYARQLVYSHNDALAIARRSHQKVLQIRDDDLKNGEVSGVDENGNPINKNDVVNPKKP
jgi:hypothetical protein